HRTPHRGWTLCVEHLCPAYDGTEMAGVHPDLYPWCWIAAAVRGKALCPLPPRRDLLTRRTPRENGTAGAGVQPGVLDPRPVPPPVALAGAVWQMVEARRLSCGNTYHCWHSPGNCHCGSAVWRVCVCCRHAAASSRHLSSSDPDTAA